MANTRGVFTLQDVRYAQEDDVWVSPDQSFFAGSTVPPNIGYYGGGGVSPGRTSAINKIDFSTETRSTIPSALNQTMSAVGGVGSINNGYFVGGFVGSDSSITEKFSYASETSGRVPHLNTSTVRYYVAAGGNENFAYCNAGAPGYQTRVDKLIYAADTMADLPASYLPTPVSNLGAVASGTNAYFGGGATSASASTNAVSKIPFATDTNAAIPGTLGLARSACKGTGNEDQGYWFGGTQSGADKSNTDKITYSSETVGAVPGANLTTVRYNTGAAGNQSTGYNLGGSPGYTSYCDKTVYSTDTTTAVPGARLTVPTGAMGTFSPRENGLSSLKGYFGNTENLKSVASPPNFGYFVGGPFNSSATEKIDFVTEVSSKVPTAQLAEDVSAPTGLASPTASYYMGRANGSAMQRITYSDETCVLVPGGSLPQLTGYGAGTNTDAVGYVAGGQGPSSPYRSWIQRVSYTSETSEMMPSGNLVRSKILPGNFSNMKNGYYVGGDTNFSDCDRLNFSSETVGGVPAGRLLNPRGYMQGSGNADAGYTAGGTNGPSGVSYTSRLTYATEFMSNIPAAFVANGAEAGAMSGNLTNGYYTSGYNPPTYYTYTYRISYTNDYSALVPSAFLQTGNRYLTGTSGRDRNLPQPRPETPTLNSSIPGSVPNTGYLGGNASPSRGDCFKIDFTTDTLTPTTSLTEARGYGGGNSSKTAAYFGGGALSGPVAKVTMDKLEYADDTITAVPGAALSQARYLFGGQVAGDSTKALWAGGYTNPAAPRNTIDKLIFSSDTTGVIPATLSAAKYGITANASPTAGYVAGGSTGGGNRRTDIDKINMSTETTSRMPSGDLPSVRTYASGISYPRAGYFVGGSSPSAISETMKLTYSTDTVFRISNFPTNVFGGFGTGNRSAGYFTGGNTPSYTTATQRLDYSTETYSRTGANLPSGTGYGASASAQSQGGRYDSNVL